MINTKGQLSVVQKQYIHILLLVRIELHVRKWLFFIASLYLHLIRIPVFNTRWQGALQKQN